MGVCVSERSSALLLSPPYERLAVEAGKASLPHPRQKGYRLPIVKPSNKRAQLANVPSVAGCGGRCSCPHQRFPACATVERAPAELEISVKQPGYSSDGRGFFAELTGGEAEASYKTSSVCSVSLFRYTARDLENIEERPT